MCCFSKPVKSVSDTKIFARMAAKGRQFLVYSMKVEAKEPLAMVLPIPVAAGTKESDVHFINLQKYPAFFDDLNSGFPVLVINSKSLGEDSARTASAPLKVFQVGSFEASLVPTVKNFTRLDARFRLPATAFDALKGYAKYGFAVFKLKAGAQTVHPMAFDFPSASTRLFFPTVHIHDGKVHDRAAFDHDLYCQPTEEHRLKLLDWEESHGAAAQFMKLELAQSVVLKDEHCYKRTMRGRLANKDTFVEQQN